ncbi:hypothetical protein Nepgr_033432 [Nepenthes gracilis]|uniref:Uncharacterized protein n=1 Tax=Nepenthes gracilis TaxID=150966 RepID=A0AAD3Y6X4_NEPGR|nr:hypothetical protein Nepgr_033432 [Nepenthes gracilis]
MTTVKIEKEDGTRSLVEEETKGTIGEKKELGDEVKIAEVEKRGMRCKNEQKKDKEREKESNEKAKVKEAEMNKRNNGSSKTKANSWFLLLHKEEANHQLLQAGGARRPGVASGHRISLHQARFPSLDKAPGDLLKRLRCSKPGKNGDDDDGPLWQRTILMGGKCQPLDFSGVIYYDSDGNRMHELPIKSAYAARLDGSFMSSNLYKNYYYDA